MRQGTASGAREELKRPDGNVLQFLAVFQEVLFLGAGDPIVVPDAIREGVEFRRHMLDVLLLPFGDLPKGKHAHAIQHALHHGSDAMNLLQVILLGGT